MKTELKLMMKCDMCYDRTSEGKKPMCASVCPSGALFFGTAEEIERLRPRSRPINEFRFGRQVIGTKVFMMVPRESSESTLHVTKRLERSKSSEPDLMMDNLFQEEL